MGPTGMGQCAEQYAFQRVNRSRLPSGYIYVAGEYHHSTKFVNAKPCSKCQKLIDKHDMTAVWRDRNGEWKAC